MSSATINTQLLQAAARGSLAEIALLIQQGADLNARDDQGLTPLMVATHTNRPDVVRALLEAGADVNIQDNQRAITLFYTLAQRVCSTSSGSPSQPGPTPASPTATAAPR